MAVGSLNDERIFLPSDATADFDGVRRQIFRSERVEPADLADFVLDSFGQSGLRIDDFPVVLGDDRFYACDFRVNDQKTKSEG